MRGARRGDPESQYDLAFMLLLGKGTPADLDSAVHWLERAVTGGYELGARLLSDIYLGKFGLPDNGKKAERWLALAERLRDGDR